MIQTDAQRAAALAGIRAYADWLEARPEVPTPDRIEGVVYDRGDQAESIAAVAKFARVFGAGLQHSSGTAWAVLDVETDGFRAEHTWFVAGDVKPSPW
jgi:hypothetical protein